MSDQMAEAEPLIVLERTVLRAKVCPDCGHPNPYKGTYPEGGYDPTCGGCQRAIADVAAGPEQLEVITIDPSTAPPSFLERLRAMARKAE